MKSAYEAAKDLIEAHIALKAAETALQKAKWAKAEAEKTYFTAWGNDDRINSPITMIELAGQNWAIEVDPTDGKVTTLQEIESLYQEVQKSHA